MIDLFAAGHGFFAHLCVTLFLLSVVAYVVSFSADKYVVISQARLMGRWALWFAAVAAIITIVLGSYAYYSSGHDDYSHGLLNNHWYIASALALVIIVLALWAGVLFNDDREESTGFLAVHVITLVAVLYVTWTGTVLVYQYGVGVTRVPDVQSHNHRTFEKTNVDVLSSE